MFCCVSKYFCITQPNPTKLDLSPASYYEVPGIILAGWRNIAPDMFLTGTTVPGPQNGLILLGPLGLQSRFGDKRLGTGVVCPQNGTAGPKKAELTTRVFALQGGMYVGNIFCSEPPEVTSCSSSILYTTVPGTVLCLQHT